MIYLIILGIVIWYGLGLVGSAIGEASMTKYLDEMFPTLTPHDTREDKAFCYLMAIAGVFNYISAILWSLLETHSLSMRWEWLK